MADKIGRLVESSLYPLQVELVEVIYRREHGDQMLRVFIDHASGVDLDLCTRVSRIIKDFVDQENIYYDHLEVSSPGLDRVLKKDSDFERFKNERVKIKTLKEYDGPRKVSGFLQGLHEGCIRVKVDEEVKDIPRSMVSTVRLDPQI